MDELLRQVRQILRGMWLYRWYGLAASWVVAAVAVVMVARMPDQYQASARVYVDTQTILKPLLSGLAVQPNIDQQLSLLSRTLLSRPNMEKLVRMTDLDLGAKTKAQQDALYDQMAKSIKINNTGRDNLYTMSFVHSDPAKAQLLVQSLLSVFVESGIGKNRTDSEQAKRFLDEQIKTYEAKLVEAENRLKEFRLKNLDIQTGDGRDSGARLAQATAQLEQARLELREAENARDSARRQLEGAGTGQLSATESLLQESAINVSTPEIDARIDSLKKNLDTLLQRYTDAHPDVVNSRKLLKDLEDQKAKEVRALRKAALAAPAAGGGGGSAVSQELQRMAAQAEVQVASLRARVAEYSARVGQARAAMRVSPELEAQAVQLNRDYAINKKSYEDLLARRQSADLSGDLDNAAAATEFRVIDPPRVEPRPAAPNRVLLLAVGLAASLAAGFGVAFLVAQIRPAFHDGGQLSERTGLPLLGVISLVRTPEDIRRTRTGLLRFYGAAGSLVSLWVIGIAATLIYYSRMG